MSQQKLLIVSLSREEGLRKRTARSQGGKEMDQRDVVDFHTVVDRCSNGRRKEIDANTKLACFLEMYLSGSQGRMKMDFPYMYSKKQS